MRSESLPAMLAMAGPALLLLGSQMNNAAGYAFIGAGWLLSLVLLAEVIPISDAS